MTLMVECSVCGKHLPLHNLEVDEEVLNNHAVIHLEQDANMRAQFNDSPITFPIQYTEVLIEE